MATINSVNTSPLQYNVQVGDVNGTTANIAPSTAGYILTSNGASAAPTFQAGAGVSIDIIGDSGGTLSGSSFTFSGGTTGLTFAGSTGPNTETLTGTLVVANGGTGAVSLTGVLTGNGTGAFTANAVTNHGVLIGGASNAVASLGVATNGQLVIGSTGANPVLAALTSTGGSISITNGAGSINLEADETIAVTYTEDSGTATPAAGNLNVVGDSLNINTSGATDTITIALENAITLGSLSAIPIDSDALTVSSGSVTLTHGNVNMPYGQPTLAGFAGNISWNGLGSIWADTNDNWYCGYNVGGGASSPVVGSGNNLIGSNSSYLFSTGSNNTIAGDDTFNTALSGSGNSCLGATALTTLDGTDNNTAIGFQSLKFLATGATNTALGYNSGSAYVGAESNNIVIGHVGVAAESAVIRLGTPGTQTATYIAGIDGVNVGSVARVVTEASNQLGTATLTAGANVTITPGANTITIAASGSLSAIDITGDSGGTLSGSAFTFTGGTTGLTFSGASTTETLVGTLNVGHGGTGATTLTGVLTGNGTGAVTANAVTNHGVLIGGASNAVASLGVATNGQLVIGSTGADPVLANLTSSDGSISITNGAGSINLQTVTGGFVWNEVTTGSATMAVDSGYGANSTGITTLTLPTSAAFGDTIKVMGVGPDGWEVVYGVGQYIVFGTVATTADTGSLSSTNFSDCIELVCSAASVTAPIFTVNASVGNISYI